MEPVFDTSNYGVYVATRNDTGEVIYVGCSWTGIKRRLTGHISELEKNKHLNSGLQRFWNSKGLTFTHVVKCLPIERLVLAFEKAYGAQYDFKKLVNVQPLGEKAPSNKGMKFPEHSKRMKGNQYAKGTIAWNKDKKCPQISKAVKGKKKSKEHCKKLSESHTGKSLTKKHCKNISKATKGENNPNCKITECDARQIKILTNTTKMTHQQIADCIPRATLSIVRDISCGNSWKDLVI